jgi:hypothetical protein
MASCFIIMMSRTAALPASSPLLATARNRSVSCRRSSSSWVVF